MTSFADLAISAALCVCVSPQRPHLTCDLLPLSVSPRRLGSLFADEFAATHLVHPSGKEANADTIPIITKTVCVSLSRDAAKPQWR